MLTNLTKVRTPEPARSYDSPQEAQAYIRGSRKPAVALVEKAFAESILKKFRHRQKLDVLDIGTGPGWIPIRIAKARPEWRLAAVDYSEPMLQFAERRARENRAAVEWIRSAAEKIELPSASFDLVISHFALHEFSDAEAALQEMRRLVKPGGAILIQDIIRPSPFLRALLTFGTFLYYPFSPPMRRQSLDTFRATYTLEEAIRLMKKCGLEAEVSRSWWLGGKLMRLAAIRKMPVEELKGTAAWASTQPQFNPYFLL